MFFTNIDWKIRLYKRGGILALIELLSRVKGPYHDKGVSECAKKVIDALPTQDMDSSIFKSVVKLVEDLCEMNSGTDQDVGDAVDHQADSAASTSLLHPEIGLSLSVLRDTVKKLLSDECESHNAQDFSLQENEKIISTALEHSSSRKLPKIKKVAMSKTPPKCALKSSMKPSCAQKGSALSKDKHVKFARDEDLVQIRHFEPHPDEVSHQVRCLGFSLLLIILTTE